jgi:hypothetical protein
VPLVSQSASDPISSLKESATLFSGFDPLMPPTARTSTPINRPKHRTSLTYSRIPLSLLSTRSPEMTVEFPLRALPTEHPSSLLATGTSTRNPSSLITTLASSTSWNFTYVINLPHVLFYPLFVINLALEMHPRFPQPSPQPHSLILQVILAMLCPLQKKSLHARSWGQKRDR